MNSGVRNKIIPQDLKSKRYVLLTDLYFMASRVFSPIELSFRQRIKLTELRSMSFREISIIVGCHNNRGNSRALNKVGGP